MSNLIPDYLNIDFNTLSDRLKTQISESETFLDVDYEGSNIATLIEMFAYIGELYTYYINKIAKNQYIDTTDTYENLHRLSTFLGYNPIGNISAELVQTFTVTLDDLSAVIGNQLSLPAWYSFNTGLTTDKDDNIYYTLTEDITETIPSSASGTHSFDVTLKQGEPVKLSFTGEDVIDNQLHLSSEIYDHGMYPYTTSSIGVYVNGVKWERISSFYNNLTPLTDTDNVFTFEYDKNERNTVKFSSYRNVPSSTSKIEIILLKSLASDGSIGANILTTFEETQSIYIFDATTNLFELIDDTPLIYNTSKSLLVGDDYITTTNLLASRYAGDPQSMDVIKYQARNNFTSQSRNVSSEDYVGYLENHSSIIKANAWGEQEETPGNTLYYYKAYFSLIPDEWDTSTVSTSALSATEWIGHETTSVPVPSEYNDDYKDTITTYLEPQKMINIYEVYVLPTLVYFRFDIGLKVKRTYNFTTVQLDVKNKLIFYFSSENVNFHSTIDFKEIHNYIMDLTNVSTSDNYSSIRGLDNFIIRDIETYTQGLSGSPIETYEYDSGVYPQFGDVSIDTVYDDNLLRPIMLGKNQFPVLSSTACTFTNEG